MILFKRSFMVYETLLGGIGLTSCSFSYDPDKPGLHFLNKNPSKGIFLMAII
jgi:hypothetical protein